MFDHAKQEGFSQQHPSSSFRPPYVSGPLYFCCPVQIPLCSFRKSYGKVLHLKHNRHYSIVNPAYLRFLMFFFFKENVMHAVFQIVYKLKLGSYFPRPCVRLGPLWYVRCENLHPPMSARVRVDPSADIRLQPKICDHTDCPLSKLADCACSFTCMNKAVFWPHFDCRYTDSQPHFTLKDFSFRSTSRITTKKEYNKSHSGKNVLSLMSAEPVFFSPIVSAWMTQV